MVRAAIVGLSRFLLLITNTNGCYFLLPEAGFLWVLDVVAIRSWYQYHLANRA